jgi:hypothetical protein
MRIEQSGMEQRWEFDKRKLFSEADYIASVAQDMFHIAKVTSYIHAYPNITKLRAKLRVLSPRTD